MIEPGDDQSAAELRVPIEQARRGDAEAFGALFERFYRCTYWLCWELLGDRDAAADAAQETFTGAWGRIRWLQHPEAFASWLRAAAVNACQCHRRKARRQRNWSELHSDRAVEEPGVDPSPAARLEGEELAGEVRRELARLAPAHREVIVLHHLEGASLRDIAALLGVAEGTVKSRLGRGRASLAELLKPYVDDEESSTSPETEPREEHVAALLALR